MGNVGRTRIMFIQLYRPLYLINEVRRMEQKVNLTLKTTLYFFATHELRGDKKRCTNTFSEFKLIRIEITL